MLPADSPFARLPAPGPHPAPTELRAYAAGTLPPAEEHRIEAHTLDCERCADSLTGFAMSDPATTERAVADLRARLQTRIGAETPVPVASGRAWPRIAAAAAVMGVVAGGIWGWEQHKTARPTATAHLETTANRPPAAPTQRQGTIPESAEPTPAQVPGAAAAAAPIASKEIGKPADYATVSPARSRRTLLNQPAGRAMQHSGSDALLMADEASAPAVENKTQNAPATTAESARKKPATLLKISLADTLTTGEAARASRAFATKSKAMATTQVAENIAGVRVANTPMPAAPTFNPAPVGGTPALRDYLYREAAEFEPEEGRRVAHGTVRLRFMVGADGKISNLKVTRSLREDYDNEALRMLCEGPKWQPGIASGHRTDLPVELSVTF